MRVVGMLDGALTTGAIVGLLTGRGVKKLGPGFGAEVPKILGGSVGCCPAASLNK
jgi:hypothetical protein